MSRISDLQARVKELEEIVSVQEILVFEMSETIHAHVSLTSKLALLVAMISQLTVNDPRIVEKVNALVQEAPQE